MERSRSAGYGAASAAAGAGAEGVSGAGCLLHCLPGGDARARLQIGAALGGTWCFGLSQALCGHRDAKKSWCDDQGQWQVCGSGGRERSGVRSMGLGPRLPPTRVAPWAVSADLSGLVLRTLGGCVCLSGFVLCRPEGLRSVLPLESAIIPSVKPRHSHCAGLTPTGLRRSALAASCGRFQGALLSSWALSAQRARIVFVLYPWFQSQLFEGQDHKSLLIFTDPSPTRPHRSTVHVC